MIAAHFKQQLLTLLIRIVYHAEINGFSSPFAVARFRSLPASLPSSFLASINDGASLDTATFDYLVEKPAGIILEEREENEASGVFCIIDESLEYSAAFVSGVRTGDILLTIDGNDVSSSSFEEVMELFANAFSPVSLTVQRQKEKPKVVMQPKRMPSTKKIMKASSSANFWKDPLMVGSAVFTIALPLGIYLAASGPK